MAVGLLLYGRPSCHLCDDARAMLERIAAELPLTWNEVNIELDDDLHKRYLEKIPVLADGDDVLAELLWDEAELRKQLGALSQAR